MYSVKPYGKGTYLCRHLDNSMVVIAKSSADALLIYLNIWIGDESC